MARRRGSSVTVYTDVEIELDEVIEELSDDEIVDEVHRRKLEPKISAKIAAEKQLDFLEEVETILRTGDIEEALLFLDQTLRPKFESFSACEAAFAKQRQ